MDITYLRNTRKKMRKHNQNGMSPMDVTQNLLMESKEKNVID